jgi:hypothetical protein
LTRDKAVKPSEADGLFLFRQKGAKIMEEVIPIVKMMTYEEADQKGLFNRGLVLDYEGRTYFLNAGLKDKIHVFTRSIYVFVLTTNISLGYIGLDAYMPYEQDPINTIFLHSEYQFSDYLGRNWRQLSAGTIALRLSNYLL